MRRWCVPDAAVAPDATRAAVVAPAVASLVRAGLPSLGLDGAEVAVLAVRSTGRVRPVASRAGRVAVAACLDAIGVAARPGRDGHGRPAWPPGCTGAVAHGAGLAIAVCLPTDPGPARTVGVDVELDDAVGERVAARVAAIGDDGPSGRVAASVRAVRFSAKESAYKAFSFASAPELAGFSFAGVRVVCHDDGTFDALAPDARTAAGRWWVLDGVVVTVAVHTR